MRRILPPLNPLRIFEVAARHESFTRAAEELRVSQAAVSRQIGVLEAYLNTQLFQRKNREVHLTDVGAQYARAASRAFDVIERGTDDLPVSRRHTRQLHVRVYSTFAQHWLIPRLSGFYAKHPQVNLQLRTSVEEVNFERDHVDVWIHFGKVRLSGVVIEPFLHDVLQPAISPKIARVRSGACGTDLLSNFTLLKTVHRPHDWNVWLRHANIGDVKPRRVDVFENSALAYEAAVEGLGYTMVQLPLVERHLRAGTLVPLFHPLVRRDTHQLIYRTARKDVWALRAFCSWIMAEGAASMAAVKDARGEIE